MNWREKMDSKKISLKKCALCKTEFLAAPYPEALFLTSMRKNAPIGYSCQHCGTFYCDRDKKKLKFNIIRGWAKSVCPHCGKPFGPGTSFYSEKAIVEIVVQDTEKVVSETEVIKDKIALQKELFEQLEVNRVAIVEEILSQLSGSRNVIIGDYDLKKIKWFGWVADLGVNAVFEDKRIEQRLVELCQSKRQWERFNAVYSLEKVVGITRSQELVPDLLEQFEKDKGVKYSSDPALAHRETLFDALAHYLDDERVLTTFLTCLEEDIVYIRVKVAEVLRNVPNDERVIQALVKALDDKKYPSERDATSLGGMMTAEGPPVCNRALDSLLILTEENKEHYAEERKEWILKRKII